jgi:FkbM family methyltransferase
MMAILRKFVPESLRPALRRLLNRPVLEHEPLFRQRLTEVVQPGWVCVDVGANIGLITCHLAQLVGASGKVYAFEPHPKTAQFLARKTARSRAEVIVVAKAVTDGREAFVDLFPGRGHTAEEWNVRGQDLNGVPTKAELRVPATSLDIQFAKGADIRLVKIDVEGAGYLVFSGMTRVLASCRPVLFVEFHNEQEWQSRQICHNAGYAFYDLDGNQVDPALSSPRVYHSIGVPIERKVAMDTSGRMSLR